MTDFALSYKERSVLEQLTRCSTNGAKEYRRTQALLWLDKGESVPEIAERLRVSRQSIYNWAMRVGGVDRRLDVGGVVVQHIEDVMTFVLIRAKNANVDRHMIGHQCVLGDALLQAEIFRRMTRADGMELRLDFLPVARRVDRVIDVVMTEDRQLGDRVAHLVVGLPQRFQTDEAVGGGIEGLVIQVGDFAPFAQADVRPVSHQAGDDRLPIQRRLHVAVEDMGKGVEALAA